MGKAKDITNTIKIRIETLLETGLYSQSEIARKIKVSRRTVARIATLIKENLPSTSSSRQHCHRPRKTTVREDRKIINTALQNRQASTRELQHLLQSFNINISERTLRSRLYAAGLKCRRPAKKPRLTETMKKKRLQWAKMHQHFTVEDWRKVFVQNFNANILKMFSYTWYKKRLLLLISQS